MPLLASWSARSYKVGPEPCARSRVGSPLSSSAQVPTQAPDSASSPPVPSTRVDRLAVPPSTLRANPVVNSLTVEAGTSGSAALTPQSIRPCSSATAMPHLPAVRRDVDSYHASSRPARTLEPSAPAELSVGEPWAAAGTGPSNPKARARAEAERLNDNGGKCNP